MLVCKYKFDSSIYADLIPTFTSDYVNYTIKDEVEGDIVTRSIESDKLPTALRLGTGSQDVGNREYSLLEVLYINASGLLYLEAMFRGCVNLTKVNIDWKKCKATTNSNYMFSGCSSLTSLDLSDLDLSNTTASSYMFNNTTLLKDIGVLNCNSDTIQKIINSIPVALSKTIWYKNTDVSNITIPSHVSLKEYREDVVEIKLNSPLLEGDTIEVIDGNLCHVHRYNNMVLDGSENWNVISVNNYGYIPYYYLPNVPKANAKKVNSDRLKHYFGSSTAVNEKCISGVSGNGDYIFIFLEDDINIIEYLSSNPLTIIYEIADFTYENITPLQSEIVLKTFEECNMNIVTNLPIKTNVSYRTNVPSITVLTAQVDEIEKSGTVVANLTDVIEQEIDK